jgi:hypothetical protein
MMVDTNDIYHTLGLSAFVMNVPGATPSMEHTRAHHKHGRISMGYNIAPTVLECSEVQLFDYEVKVKMEQIQLPPGELTCPRPPYARTTIRKELQ